MNTQEFTVNQGQAHRLLSAQSADAALLYIYLCAGNAPDSAARELGMQDSQAACALALLRQLGLYEEKKATFVPGERPGYSEGDVTLALQTDNSFKALYSEVQRQLGKALTSEELKILLGFNRYLGLPNEVVSILVSWCRERNRQRGVNRNPSLRTIEKEAYFWAEHGIDTLEEAAAYIRKQNLRATQAARLLQILQIRGRKLTPGEQRFAESWLEMGFEEAVLAHAYDRTCVNTGAFSWRYMDRILTRWHMAGLHTMDAVKKGDKKDIPQGASGKLGGAELEALQHLLQED